VAACADWWNHIFRSTAEYASKARRLGEHCEEAGRDPGEIRHVLGTQLLIAETEREVRSMIARDDVRSVAQNGIAGTPEAIFETLSQAIRAGAGMVVTGFADSPRQDGALLFSETVLPWLQEA
jgi:alkanesulfonate monooxygenase SsuD/methylene tetrahydromethanopterin reductase-like flavin-dependent oxidoreductase (luciferase family)